MVKLDRLTRSVRDLGLLVETYFLAGKWSLMSVSEQTETRPAAGRMVLNILAAVSQWEREIIGERTAEAMAYKRQQRGYTGGEPPYGWQLAARGLLPRQGRAWNPKTVRDLLQVEVAQMAKHIDLARPRAAEERLAEHLRQRSGLAARTAQFLAGHPSVQTMENLMTEPLEKPTQLRLPREALERAEILIPLLAKHPEFRALGRLSKATVLRLAVLHGLEVLEHRIQPTAAEDI